MLRGQASEFFTWHELLRSSEATRLGISNQPSLSAASNLTRVAILGLDPTRRHFGKPAAPSSGYRSPALNKAIGGSTTSNHSIGCATDFEIPGVDNYEVADWMTKNIPNFDEIILERYTPGKPNSGWIHFAMRPENNRRKILTWDGKIYMRGLVR